MSAINTIDVTRSAVTSTDSRLGLTVISVTINAPSSAGISQRGPTETSNRCGNTT
jgi:hypothetical protein